MRLVFLNGAWPGRIQLPSLPKTHRGLGPAAPGYHTPTHMSPLFQSQDCIAAALASSKILKELSREEEDTDSTEEMLALAEWFELRAIGEHEGSSTLRGGHRRHWKAPPNPVLLSGVTAFPPDPSH